MMRSSTAAILAAIGMMLSSGAAHAGDVLIRQTVPYRACVQLQNTMMRNLGVDPNDLEERMHTGAILQRAFVGQHAELVLSCNKVTDTLEVVRFDRQELQPAEFIDARAGVVVR